MPNKTLTQAILGGLWRNVSTTPQSAIGVGKHLIKYGLPDSVEFPEGRPTFIDKDVTDPEATGEFISMPADREEAALPHELRHADQNDILGPAMIAARLAEAFMPYGSGPLERDAIQKTEPTSELVRKPSPSGYTNLVQKLFRATLR